MLGWLLLDRGDLDGAGRRFEAALGDRDAEVVTSVRAGLSEIAARRP